MGIDSKEVASVRLAVDTLKWAAEKNDPDRFGKKEERSEERRVGKECRL